MNSPSGKIRRVLNCAMAKVFSLLNLKLKFYLSIPLIFLFLILFSFTAIVLYSKTATILGEYKSIKSEDGKLKFVAELSTKTFTLHDSTRQGIVELLLRQTWADSAEYTFRLFAKQEMVLVSFRDATVKVLDKEGFQLCEIVVSSAERIEKEIKNKSHFVGVISYGVCSLSYDKIEKVSNLECSINAYIDDLLLSQRAIKDNEKRWAEAAEKIQTGMTIDDVVYIAGHPYDITYEFSLVHDGNILNYKSKYVYFRDGNVFAIKNNLD